MSEKTEQPTPKKLRDARNKGQVANSKEVVTATLICMTFAYFWLLGDYYLTEIEKLIHAPTQIYSTSFKASLKFVLETLITGMIKLIAPYLAMVVAFGMISNMIQVGVLFVFDPVKPELKKINPVEGAKKIFSKKSLFEILKSIIKIIFLGSLIFMLIRSNIQDFTKIPLCGTECLPSFIGNLFKWLFICAAVAFLIIAVVDFFWQKTQHIKQLKMSKDEVIREYKETEGDPQIKGKRKQIHQELLESEVKPRVKKSTAIVVNPTHVAVGIYYQQGVTDLPVITIMGTDGFAQRIKAIAREEGIPMMENIYLARCLLAQSEVDAYIPSDLIEPVVEVLKWVQNLEDDC